MTQTQRAAETRATGTELKLGGEYNKELNDMLANTGHTENLQNTLFYCRALAKLLADQIVELDRNNISSGISFGICALERMLENACNAIDI